MFITASKINELPALSFYDRSDAAIQGIVGLRRWPWIATLRSR
jgi:hypothetical protein